MCRHSEFVLWRAVWLQVKGFNVRNWMRENKKKIPPMLESLAKLVNANKLQAAYTE